MYTDLLLKNVALFSNSFPYKITMTLSCLYQNYYITKTSIAHFFAGRTKMWGIFFLTMFWNHLFQLRREFGFHEILVHFEIVALEDYITVIGLGRCYKICISSRFLKSTVVGGIWNV
jgi:hypothetical protein